MKIIPVNNNTFGVYSDTTLELCTRLYLYFRTDFDSINNFSFTLKLLSTAWQINWTSTNTTYVRLADISDNGVISNGVSIGSSTTITKDQTNNTLNWMYSGNNPERDSYIVTIEFQNFMLGSTPIYFEVLDLSINGEETVFSAGEQAIVNQLQNIENILTDESGVPIDTSDIPSAPDVSDIQQGMNGAISGVNDFLNYFASGGPVGRVLQPVSTYLTVADSFGDSSVGHFAITIIFKYGLALVVIAFIINGIKRRSDFG